MIYLDNAATSWPKPDAVYQTLGAFLRDFGANPGRAGHRMAAGAAGRIAHVRLVLARLMNAESPERVVFAANATDALNLAIRGLIRPGDRVVTTTMEHNSVVRPLRSVQDRGAEVIKIACPPDTGVVEPSAVAAAASGARLVVCTHASNVTGAIQPVPELAEIARRQGALLLVDGAQTLGSMPLDVQRFGIDLLAFPGHKALMGPPGTGGLYVGPRVSLDELEPIRSGGTGTNSEEDVPPSELPSRYESGTLNTVGIAALGAGAEFVAQTGIETVWRHERELTARLVAGLASLPRVRVFPAGLNGERAPVVSFVIEGWTPADVGAVLDQSFDIACRTGLHCAPDACKTIGAYPLGTVRFSPGWFNTADEIDQAVGAVAELAASPPG